MLDLQHDRLGMFPQQVACAGYGDAARIALEKPYAEFLFEEADHSRECGLRDSEPLGGVPKAPELGNGDEISELPKVHERSPWVLSGANKDAYRSATNRKAK
jgi:hypothetical protein